MQFFFKGNTGTEFAIDNLGNGRCFGIDQSQAQQGAPGEIIERTGTHNFCRQYFTKAQGRGWIRQFRGSQVEFFQKPFNEHPFHHLNSSGRIQLLCQLRGQHR